MVNSYLLLIRDLYKEFVKDVGVERAPALVPDHWGVISSLKQDLQEHDLKHSTHTPLVDRMHPETSC